MGWVETCFDSFFFLCLWILLLFVWRWGCFDFISFTDNFLFLLSLPSECFSAFYYIELELRWSFWSCSKSELEGQLCNDKQNPTSSPPLLHFSVFLHFSQNPSFTITSYSFCCTQSFSACLHKFFLTLYFCSPACHYHFSIIIALLTVNHLQSMPETRNRKKNLLNQQVPWKILLEKYFAARATKEKRVSSLPECPNYTLLIPFNMRTLAQ